MPQPLIIDLHLDLAWDALFWNRDLTLTAHEVRRQEESDIPQVAPGFDTGLCSVTFPEMRRGSVGIMLSTIMSRIEPRYEHSRRDGMAMHCDYSETHGAIDLPQSPKKMKGKIECQTTQRNLNKPTLTLAEEIS
jgi:hypothetical protein